MTTLTDLITDYKQERSIILSHHTTKLSKKTRWCNEDSE